MKRILFIRDYKHRTGGHVTVRDYFLHCMAHPNLDPYVWFTPSSDMANNDLWANIPKDRFVGELDPASYDLLFIGGTDWQFLAKDLGETRVINAILHVRHAVQKKRRDLLSRPAYRICNSQEVEDAIRPYANGPTVTIPNAVDYSIFRPDALKQPGSVLIWGEKVPEVARSLHEALIAEGVQSRLMLESIPRAQFAEILSQADIFVTLPNETEGFYRPGLEGMACRCAVVCSDAVGTRAFAIDGQTCLQPPYASFDGYLEATRRLLTDESLRAALREGGYEKAQEFSLEAQRRRFYTFLSAQQLV